MDREDLAVERQMLRLRTRERDHFTAWAQHLAYVAQALIHGEATEGGLSQVLAMAESAGVEPRYHERLDMEPPR